MVGSSRQHSANQNRNLLIKNQFLIILVAVLLTSCSSEPLSTNKPINHSLKIAQIPSATGTPRPSEIVKIESDILRKDIITEKTQTNTPIPSQTITPFSLSKPALGIDSYRLHSWDMQDSLYVLDQALTNPVSEDFANIRIFYQVSVINEIFLNFPSTRADIALIEKLAKLKGDYQTTYGLLHDRSSEPFRQLFEWALNKKITHINDLEKWLSERGLEVQGEIQETTHLFGNSEPAYVIKITSGTQWNFFIICPHSDGTMNVLTLYPEWEQVWWSSEDFQLIDLNANGKEEIGIVHKNWGSGFTHFCRQTYALYEWDGSNFKNLIPEPFETFENTDFGNCLEVTFSVDHDKIQKISMGTELSTLCADVPYREITFFQWNGDIFEKQKEIIPFTGQETVINRCTIDWALKAGPDIDEAVKILSAALNRWPSEAEIEWGPAARDYFRLKLGVWYLYRGEIDQGFSLIKLARDYPFSPEYKFPSRTAAVFLDAYSTGGFRKSINDVNQLFLDELEPMCGFCDFGVSTDKLRQKWGFAEREWDVEAGATYGPRFPEDFSRLSPVKLSILKNAPDSLEELITVIKRNGMEPIWSIEGDLDGIGQIDWLVDIKLDNNSNNNEVYAFLRQENEVRVIDLWQVLTFGLGNSYVHAWQSYSSEIKLPPENILQIGNRLYAFRFVPKAGNNDISMDIDSFQVFPVNDRQRVHLKEWKITDNRLSVIYDGRQASYLWNESEGKFIPTDFSPELQEKNVRDAEQALYSDGNPQLAIYIIKRLLDERIYEVFDSFAGPGNEDLRLYLRYLLGLAYERSGDQANAIKTYWQLWHDYPGFPFSFAAQSKLQMK